jgi:predicted hydrocarbon binding protein
MGAIILVKSNAEEELMFELLKEFGTKVTVSRRGNLSETFKTFSKQGVFGVLEVEKEKDTNHKLYELALPDAFVGYIEYEVQKLRDFLSSVKQ